VVQGLLPAPGGGDGNLYIVLYLVLPDEVIKAPGTEAAIKRFVLGVGLARDYALYFTAAPFLKVSLL